MGTTLQFEDFPVHLRTHSASVLEQALEETFLVARLAVALYSYLGLGTKWTGKLLRLILYATLLLPGFIQVSCSLLRCFFRV